MTQEEIAEYLGYTKSAYQKWETEVHEPPPSTLEYISRMLKIPIEDFFDNASEGEKRYER